MIFFRFLVTTTDFLLVNLAKDSLREQFRTKKSTPVLLIEIVLLTRHRENDVHTADFRNV